MIYLVPHLSDPKHRPELVPYGERMRGLRYEFRSGKRKAKTIRQVGSAANGNEKGAGESKRLYDAVKSDAPTPAFPK
jgi:hypothetical protein